MMADTRSLRLSGMGNLKKRQRSSEENLEYPTGLPTMRKISRVDNNGESHIKRFSLHGVFTGRGSKRSMATYDEPISAQYRYASSDYTENIAGLISPHELESPLLASDTFSFEQIGTPASKTKRSHSLQGWLSRIHHHGKNHNLSMLRFNKSPSQFIESKMLSSPAEELPEDAFSCYYQYRTENIGDFYDTLMLEDKDSGKNTDYDKLPMYSPLNELTYENLQSLRKQLFSLPPLSADSNDSDSTLDKRETAILEEEEEETFSQQAVGEELVDKVSNIIETTYSILETDEGISDNGSEGDIETVTESIALEQIDNQSINEPEDDLSEASFGPSIPSVKDSAELYHINFNDNKHTIQTEDKNSHKENIDKDLQDEEISCEEDCDLDSSEFQQIETASTNEGLLTPIEDDIPTEESLPRSRSVLKRVFSVFKSEKPSISDTNSLSSNSTYTPISISVPALVHDRNIISGLAENLSEGLRIDDVYDPDDLNPFENDDYEYFDSNEINHLDGQSDLLTSDESPRTVENRIASIKFDKFAQLLLYDGSGRSKYQKSKNHQKSFEDFSLEVQSRQEAYKNRGSLCLNPDASQYSLSKLKTLKLPKFSRYSVLQQDHGHGSERYDSIDQIVKILEDSLAPVRPILKSRQNINEKIESLRATYCDQVEVEDFIDFFESHEQNRLDSEPYLGRVREKQLSDYYSAETSAHTATDSSVTTDISTFDV